jgi:hypothetical protein
MKDDMLQTYLETLSNELAKRGLRQGRIEEEVREHLVDSIEAGCRRGLPRDVSVREALDRFGSPEMVAARFAAERHRILRRVMLSAAVLLGIAIAWVDSRPTWDDTGVTAFSMLLSGVVFGLIRPERPWQWALGIGIWICLHQILHHPTLGSLAGSLVILAFPMAGAYLGAFCRRAFSKTRRAGTP